MLRLREKLTPQSRLWAEIASGKANDGDLVESQFKQRW